MRGGVISKAKKLFKLFHDIIAKVERQDHFPFHWNLCTQCRGEREYVRIRHNLWVLVLLQLQNTRKRTLPMHHYLREWLARCDSFYTFAVTERSENILLSEGHVYWLHCIKVCILKVFSLSTRWPKQMSPLEPNDPDAWRLLVSAWRWLLC
jgi:hypothetical protein